MPSLGGLPQPTVSAAEIAVCLGTRALHYRDIKSGQPVAIVAVFRAGTADPSSPLNPVAQRLGLVVDTMRIERIWLAVWRRRGEG